MRECPPALGDDLDVDVTPKHAICNATDGKSYLTEEQIVDPDENWDLDMLAGP